MNSGELAAEVVALALAAIVGFAAVTWLITSAARKTPEAMVAIILGLITVLALGVFLFTYEDSDVAGTIAATGVGAFAGALTKLFGDKKTSADADSDPRESASEEQS